MVLTKEMTYGEVEHVMGDMFKIPVTLTLKDGASTVFTHTIDVDHKTNRTLEASITNPQVENQLTNAIEGYLDKKAIEDANTEITNALDLLKAKLPTEKQK